MAHIWQFEQYTIQKVDMEREINFIVMKGPDYQFRLVPGVAGFELSPIDKALDTDEYLQLINRISNFIVDIED